MRQSFKFQLKPNKTQNRHLFECLNLCQDLYNAAIEERLNAYHKWAQLGKPDKWDQWPSRSSQQVELKEAKQLEGLEDYRDLINAQALQEVLRRVNLAYHKFFQDLKKGQVNPPKFKGKGQYKSLTFPQYGKSFRIRDNHLHLSKIGPVKIRLSRKITGKIKTVTIKWEHGHWFAIFSCDKVPQRHIAPSDKQVGIDYGLEHIANFSNGEAIEQPRFLRDMQTQLRLAQRKLSKKKKGGRNRNKQRVKVAKMHSKIERRRADFQHKEVKKIVDQFGEIAFEAHSLQFMVKNKRLSQSTVDRAIGCFKQKLSSQAQKAGRMLVEVSTTDKQGIGNSQRCLCGYVLKKKLSQRTHKCPSCGVEVPRDHMAASIVEYRAFGTAPKWYQYAVGQTVKSPDRAMVAATLCSSTPTFSITRESGDTPVMLETSRISDTDKD